MSKVRLIEDVYEPRDGLSLYACNNCNGIFPESYSVAIPEYKFCPHCGVSIEDDSKKDSVQSKLEDLEKRVSNLESDVSSAKYGSDQKKCGLKID